MSKVYDLKKTICVVDGIIKIDTPQKEYAFIINDIQKTIKLMSKFEYTWKDYLTQCLPCWKRFDCNTVLIIKHKKRYKIVLKGNVVEELREMLNVDEKKSVVPQNKQKDLSNQMSSKK